MTSKVGHILTTTFGKGTIQYVIIAQKKNHLGDTVYVLSDWNETSNRFLEMAGNSYFFQVGKATISESAYPMSEAHQAMARAFRLSQIIRKLNKRIRRVGAGEMVNLPQLIAATGYRTKWDMHDKTGYLSMDSEPEFTFGNPVIKAQSIALRGKLLDSWIVEMKLAGIL